MQLQLFDKNKFKSINLDAIGGIFFAGQLESVQSTVYEFEYPPFKAFTLIPITYDIPAGAEYWTVTGYQSVGRARVIESYADDLPEAGILGTQLTNKILSVGSSYRYSHQEIRAAMLANMPLDSRLAIAARRAIDQKINELALFGDPLTGMYGLLNNPNIPTITVPADGVGGSTEWSTKTPEQILRDMNLVVNQIVVNSNEVEAPDTLLLPLDQYTYIKSMPRSINSDTTILNYFLMNNPFITRVLTVPQMAGYGLAGSNIMMAYDSTGGKLAMGISMPFTQYAPQERNLEFVINCEARFAGVSIYYPMSTIIGEGI